MLDLQKSRNTILREWEKFIARLKECHETKRGVPVRCEGWRIQDLAAHVAWGMSLQADALDRMRHGVTEPANAASPDPGLNSQEIIEMVISARDRFAGKLEQLSPDDLQKTAPMPYGAIPVAFALQIFVMEAGIHGDDLADALSESEGLDEDVIRATTTVLQGTLPILAQSSKDTPTTGMTYRLSGRTVSIDLAYGDSAWQVCQLADQPDCQIYGGESEIVLFALGRIPVTDSRLTVIGDFDMARKFKHYFPGP